MTRSGRLIFTGKWSDTQNQIRTQRDVEVIASLRIAGKSPFTVHPEIKKRVEKENG